MEGWPSLLASIGEQEEKGVLGGKGDRKMRKRDIRMQVDCFYYENDKRGLAWTGIWPRPGMDILGNDAQWQASGEQTSF